MKEKSASVIRTIHLSDPEYKKNPIPAYTKRARKKGYQGSVELLVLISKQGSASQIKLKKSTGHKILDQQAIKTVKRWTFEPRKKNGIPIETWVIVPMKFKLY